MFHHGTILVILLYSIILRNHLKRLEWNLDEKNTTPSDFAIMVSNLPKATPEEVKKYFEEALEDIEVVYVNHAYDIRKLLKLKKEATKIRIRL